jgi:D-alanyl-lipoteichoic acid acyltransferase DltB (MBOAT superfamily)
MRVSERGICAYKHTYIYIHAQFGIYLKFVVIWRVTRMLAMWDDITTIENMQRCMFSNCLSVKGFWQVCRVVCV